MTGIPQAAPAPADAAAPVVRVAAWRSSWITLIVSSLARAVLALAASLVLWAMLPAAFGWHTTVVMSGSMEPRLHTGDVVASRPISSGQLKLGQVLLVNDPDHAGRLRMHRLVAFRPDGTLTLRGDANPANDSTPVQRSAVRGLASVRVPFVGLVPYWLQTHNLRDLLLGAAALAAVIAAAFAFRLPREDAAETTHTPRHAADDDDVEPDSAAVADPPADDPPADDPPADTEPVPTRRAPRVLPATLLLVALFVAATVGWAPSAHAASKFSGPGANAGNGWGAATYFSCTNAVIGDNARFAWPLSESVGTTATDVTSNGLNGTYSLLGVTYGVTGPCRGKTGVTLDGLNGNVSVNATATSIPEISFEVWFKTTGTHGGILESLTTTGTLSDTTSMAMAVTSTGTLTLAISANGTKSISTTTAFNDNQWHLAVGVIGASGMALYVDNRPPVTSTAVTSATTATGTPRIGYGNHLSLNTGSNNYFQGSVAYASLYKLSLTAAQVLSHYNAT